jgi:signal transduction histidine kinase
VTADRYEERRAIERALHDGVQQHLVALAVNLQLARELCDSDPGAVKAFLEELGRDVHAALDDARQLGTAIYPPVLTDHGVAEALRATEARIDASDLGRYPPRVEATVYFACMKALEGAGPATVRLCEHGGSLVFEVLDEDGTRLSGAVPLE